MKHVKVGDWLRTGEFAGLTVGASRQTVESCLGPPEDGLAGHKLSHSPVWCYWPLQVGFEDDRLLWLQVDTCHLDGAESQLKLDFEGLHHGASLTFVVEWVLARQFNFDLRFESDGITLYLDNAFLSLTGSPSTLVNIFTPGATDQLRRLRAT